MDKRIWERHKANLVLAAILLAIYGLVMLVKWLMV